MNLRINFPSLLQPHIYLNNKKKQDPPPQTRSSWKDSMLSLVYVDNLLETEGTCSIFS